MKKSLYIIILLVVFAIAWGIRSHSNNEPQKEWIKLQGSVFHTFYHITYEGTSNYEEEINQLFREFDGSLSMFNDTSIISRMNRNDTTVVANPYFRTVFEKGRYVSERTEGAFDMTVAPLVNLWGFGFKNAENVSQAAVDSILLFVGYKDISLDDAGRLHKKDPRTILDASSIAKGYMSDVVADYFKAKGVENYMVEIGGEIALHGHNPRNASWTVGISRPIPDSLQMDNGYQAYMKLSEGGIATSGNYRNFYDKGGKRYAHTIDPHTGYPIQRDVLSATVIAADCMTADAFATSFMVMGSEKALEVLAHEEGVEGYLILPSKTDSTQLEVVYSSGFSKYIAE